MENQNYIVRLHIFYRGVERDHKILLPWNSETFTAEDLKQTVKEWQDQMPSGSTAYVTDAISNLPQTISLLELRHIYVHSVKTRAEFKRSL